ncbi:hypothetical protein HMPREF9551_04930 [Escherichia coli MS 196-1]|nr:hypothetical protein HMPREF9551_04930 [Escherichia coli MS 196-1]
MLLMFIQKKGYNVMVYDGLIADQMTERADRKSGRGSRQK